MEFGLQDFTRWQQCEVVSHPDVALLQLQQFYVFLAFSGTEDEANGCCLALLALGTELREVLSNGFFGFF